MRSLGHALCFALGMWLAFELLLPVVVPSSRSIAPDPPAVAAPPPPASAPVLDTSAPAR